MSDCIKTREVASPNAVCGFMRPHSSVPHVGNRSPERPRPHPHTQSSASAGQVEGTQAQSWDGLGAHIAPSGPCSRCGPSYLLGVLSFSPLARSPHILYDLNIHYFYCLSSLLGWQFRKDRRFFLFCSQRSPVWRTDSTWSLELFHKI